MMLARPVRLLALFILSVLVPLGLRPLWIPDESRYAEIAREMLESGHWVVPQLLGLPYFEKPVAGYWFTAISQGLLGQNLFASRLPVALATALSAVVVGTLAQRMWRDSRTTLIAVLIYLSFGLVAGMAVYITLDPQLALWLNLSLLAFHGATNTRDARRRLAAWAVVGAACGMAFLTKGFVGWALPVLVAAPYMLWQRRMGELLRYGPLAVLVAVAIAAPWALAVHRQAPDFWNFFFWNEHVRRFAQADAQHARPFWFYLPVLLAGCVPWLGLLPAAARNAWAQKKDPNVGFLAIWLVLPLVFFSLSRGKLPTYILPCFTPLALLLARAVARPGDAGAFRTNAAINGLIGIAGLIALPIARQRGIFTSDDLVAWLVAMAVALAWLLVAVAQWWRPARYWEGSALPLLLLAASLPAAVTLGDTDSKIPSVFIREHLGTLSNADFLLSNDAGLSANLAWDLKRTDVTLYARKGELQYGLGTPCGERRFVSRDDASEWIASARRKGSVAVVLRLTGADDPDIQALPDGASQRALRNRLALVTYPRLAAP